MRACRCAITLAVGLLAVLASAPSAIAADSSVGDTSLAATGASTIGVGQGVPVFQGDARGGYTVSATAAEILGSWSFRTAGIGAGMTFELAVLAPVDNTGTNWRLIATSPVEMVTSANGTDAVMGPFALHPAIAVDVGYRIALVPMNGSDVPIERGTNGQDGVRYFTQPFSSLGSSQSIAPGSTMDNGQVVPIQATIGSGSGAPPPVVGKAVDAAVVSGTVLIKQGSKFVPLTHARQIPVGAELDTRAGTVSITAASGTGHTTYNGHFKGAIFKITQSRSGKNRGLSTLSLLEGASPHAPTFASCHGSSHRVLQTLHSSDRGHFRSRGHYAAATVRGTIWDTTDRCDGTLIAVKRGSVVVTDFRRHKNIVLTAGHSYLAKAA